MMLGFSNGIINVTADEEDYILEGYITNDEEEGIENIEITITNLDEEESENVITDEDGYYSLDLTDEGWDTEAFYFTVETTNAEELDYLDASIYGSFSTSEGLIYDENMVLQGLTACGVYYSIYCGETTVTINTGNSKSTKFVDSDETTVDTNPANNKIQVSFDTHFNDLRTTALQWSWECFIETNQLDSPYGNKLTIAHSGNYYGPQSEDHSPSHYYTVNGAASTLYSMESYGGYKIYDPYSTLFYTGAGVHTYSAYKVGV